MAVLEQWLSWAQTYSWFPALAFVGIVAAVYLLIRPRVLEPDLATATEAPPSAPPTASVMPKNQRAVTRRQGNTVEVHVALLDKKDKPDLGSVLDRSVGGMRLALFHEVAVGTVLAVHPVRGSDMVPWVELEVRSCKESTEMPGQYEVGCQYVKSPPYSIQLLFG